MNCGKNNRLLWVAVAGVVLAWPFGELIGLVFSAGQDGPGRALAYGFGSIATIVVWVISTGLIIWALRKGAGQLSKRARVGVALAIAFLPGLAIISAVNYQVYDLRVWNQAGATVENVSISMIGREYTYSSIRDGITATRSFVQGRPSGIAEIRWTGEDGQTHMVEVDLSEIVPRRYNNGVLTFVILSEGNARVGFFIRKKHSF